jgi:hypothetical protein
VNLLPLTGADNVQTLVEMGAMRLTLKNAATDHAIDFPISRESQARCGKAPPIMRAALQSETLRVARQWVGSETSAACHSLSARAAAPGEMERGGSESVDCGVGTYVRPNLGHHFKQVLGRFASALRGRSGRRGSWVWG